MPLGQTCILCKTHAEFRCQNCELVAFYCHNCLTLLHRKTNFLHVAEKWEASGVARGGLRGLEHPLSQTKKKKKIAMLDIFKK